MTAWKKKLVLLACGLATTALVPAASCEANGLFGWLRARRAQRVAYYGASACQPACQPACGTCQQTVQYAPQTCYRNSWTQVSVTNYRPVQSVDPCTGCQVTYMQPCTSYRWAVQRVPYTTYRPVYTAVAPACSPCGGCATGGCSACSSCGTGSIVASGGCSSCAAAATIAPATTAPGQYYQGGAIQAAPVPGSALPADAAPALPPASLEPGATTYRLQPGSSTHTTIVEETETDVFDITPIPDLSAPHSNDNNAPRLLNEDDRRASRPLGQGVPAHLISWSHSETIQTTSVEFSEPAPATVNLEEEVWDDSGWETVH